MINWSDEFYEKFVKKPNPYTSEEERQKEINRLIFYLMNQELEKGGETDETGKTN